MRDAIIAAALFPLGCSWTPVVHQYPSGLRIVRVDQATIRQSCPGKTWDDGTPRNGVAPAGCYDAENDTIYLQNNDIGSRALTHELAHRERIADPSRGGFDW